MNTTTRISTAERFGRWLGRGWRGVVRGERRVLAWLRDKGVPVTVAVALVWAVKLAIFGMLLYMVFWVALLALFMMGAAWAAEHLGNQEEDDFMNRKAEERDHRESLFYHPINYNDDPDPRFQDR